MMESETIKIVAQVTSSLVALVALFIGLRNEARNQMRFESQLSQALQVARGSAKPLLSIEYEGYEDVKAMTLANHGPGTAICQIIKFVRGKKEAADVSELLKINKDYDIEWNESTAYATPCYIAGKSSEDMFRVTQERLRECGVAANKTAALLEDIEQQLDEIVVIIEYEDVFGTKFSLKHFV